MVQPEPAVDGNVMRVLSRILLIREDITKVSTRKLFEKAVRELIFHENPSYFNQALMELGALICTPTSPACLLCPVREHCHAFAEGVQSELPVKTRKKSTKHVDILAAVLKNDKEQFLIRKRPEKGLLANLWEFPNVEESAVYIQARSALTAYLNTELKAEVKLETGSFVKVNHVFTHLTWTVDAYAGNVIGTIEEHAWAENGYSRGIRRTCFSCATSKNLAIIQRATSFIKISQHGAFAFIVKGWQAG